MEIDYTDVRVIDSVFTYFLSMRSKELSEEQLKRERLVQRKFWSVQDQMKNGLKNNKDIVLVAKEEK